MPLKLRAPTRHPRYVREGAARFEQRRHALVPRHRLDDDQRLFRQVASDVDAAATGSPPRSAARHRFFSFPRTKATRPALPMLPQGFPAMSQSLMFSSTCAFVRPIPLALSSICMSMASPKVTSLRFCPSAGTSSNAPRLARSSSRFKIVEAAIERGSKVRFSRKTDLRSRRMAIWARQATEPPLRCRLRMPLESYNTMATDLHHLLENPAETGLNRNKRHRNGTDSWATMR